MISLLECGKVWGDMYNPYNRLGVIAALYGQNGITYNELERCSSTDCVGIR